MKASELTTSKYLKKDDCDPPIVVTVARLKKENVARDDEPREEKWIVYFEESDKGLVLNTTNINSLTEILGSDETDDWVGQKVVLWNNPHIEFGGRVVGGIRIRATRRKAHAGEAREFLSGKREAPADNAEFDDDLPF